ncbi:PTS sugar transporter subunit IIA [Agromyces aurantiacus]|uniref:Ascorbate-specific PTS system EIIA component n=1 Tax=Agromyces aurantiacus TaxID=165814 RepID=A0ABV9R651_9MICO|nr:PTS sugar transporter subunit IIA [Agromyces aurantiacus]MBM7504114.1 PTS system ascorbate-specific IIA component [Agromyces aurantiacus]
MTLPPLPDAAVTLHAEAGDWRAAVREAGRALARSGATREGYADRMIEVLEEFGAYIVIAPGLALAHARPGPDVLRSGLAVVTLAEPVAFGHPHNDPVRVVVGLAVSNAEEHVASVAGLANVFNERTAIDRLAAAASIDDVRAVFDGAGAPSSPGGEEGAGS